MLEELSHAQWQEYEREGYLRLGRCMSDDELAAIQQRMDGIMLGTAPVDYSRMMMQLDRIPGKTDAPGSGSKGHKGATLHYRKIQDLEFDPLFLRYMQKPLFRHICCMVYGTDTPVTCMRAMFMNKPAADPADGDGQAGAVRRRHQPRLAPGPLDLFRPRSPDHHLDRARPGHRRQRLRPHCAPPPSRPDQPQPRLRLYDR